MKKSKRNRPQRARRPRERDSLQLVPHPFAGIDPDALKEVLLAVADQKSVDFPKFVADLVGLFRRVFPTHLLAVVATYGLQAMVTKDGVGKPLSTTISQHHLEILQAVALTIPEAEWGHNLGKSEDIQFAIDTIEKLAEAFHHRRFKVMAVEKNDQEKAVLALQERVRLHTQVVRNWGAFSQVIRISLELYGPLDDDLRDRLGFSASDLVLTAKAMVASLEKRNSERMRWLGRVFREHNLKRIVRLYYKYHPSAEGDPEEFIKSFLPGLTKRDLMAMLLSHADLLLIDHMKYSPAVISEETGIPAGTVERVLEALSLAPGDLTGSDPEHFFMTNPVWVAPLMKAGGDYLCSLPQSIFSQIHAIFRHLSAKAGLAKQLEQRRAAYLEAKVQALLTRILPNATLRNGTKWRLTDIVYETDHLAVLDTTAVIIEDKSAALTEAGLRGAPDRVRRHVRELIADPSEQSLRLEEQIWKAAAKDPGAKATLAPFDIDFGGIERVVRLSVTLDDFTALASAESELKEAGWVSAELSLAPTMNVADLETVVDVLVRPSFFLHYLAERQAVQKSVHIMADEWDFLGCYLENGLNLGDLKSQNVSVALTGMSSTLDNYYGGIDAGLKLEKPSPKLSPYMTLLIDAIERKAFPHWTTVTTDLLRCAGYQDQLKLERFLAKLKRDVEQNWRLPEHECSLVANSHALGDTVVVFFAYPPELAGHRRERAQELAAQIQASRGGKRYVVISRNTARWDEAYTTVFILNF